VPSLSYGWRGIVNTIENVAYGIKGGTAIDLILLFPAIPPQDFIIWPGYGANFAFSTIYGLVATTQYESTLQLFEKWNLKHEWGPSVSPVPTRSPTKTTKKSKKFKKSKKKKKEKSSKNKSPSKMENKKASKGEKEQK